MFCEFNRELHNLLEKKKNEIKVSKAVEKVEEFKNDLGAGLYQFFPVPFIFPNKDFQVLSTGIKHILDAQTVILNKLHTKWGKSVILDYFQVPRQLQAYVDWERLLKGSQTVARVDIVPHTKGYSVCEINVHTGVGGMTCSRSYDLQMDALGVEKDEKLLERSPYWNLAKELKIIIEKNSFSRLVILDWKSHGDKGYPSFTLMKDVFEAAGLGLPIYTCTEKDFPSEWLQSEESRKTIVYRGFSYDEVRHDSPFLHSLFKSNAKVVFSFEDELRTNKRWLALFWDESYRSILTMEQKAAISDLIPFSFLMKSSDIETLVMNKNNYIFKANEGFGGKGIQIGKECSDSQLKVWFEEVGVENLLVQEFIETDTLRTFSSLDKPATEHKFVIAIYVYGEQTKGLVIRGSEVSDIVNVSSGLAKTGWAKVMEEQEKLALLQSIERL